MNCFASFSWCWFFSNVSSWFCSIFSQFVCGNFSCLHCLLLGEVGRVVGWYVNTFSSEFVVSLCLVGITNKFLCSQCCCFSLRAGNIAICSYFEQDAGEGERAEALFKYVTGYSLHWYGAYSLLFPLPLNLVSFRVC